MNHTFAYGHADQPVLTENRIPLIAAFEGIPCSAKVAVEYLEHAGIQHIPRARHIRTICSCAGGIRDTWSSRVCLLQVDFETELNMGPYMSNRRAGPQIYELYGAGHSVHSGHYYCFVRGPNGIWHHMDDTRVSQVGIFPVKSCRVVPIP